MSSFFKHPKSVGMTYIDHFKFSMKLGYLFFCGSVKAIIHAIYPDVYITSSGDYSKVIIEMIHEKHDHNHDHKQSSSSEIENNNLQSIWDWNYLKKNSLKLTIPSGYKDHFFNMSPTDIYRFVHDSNHDNTDNDNTDNIDNIDDGVNGVRFKLD